MRTGTPERSVEDATPPFTSASAAGAGLALVIPLFGSNTILGVSAVPYWYAIPFGLLLLGFFQRLITPPLAPETSAALDSQVVAMVCIVFPLVIAIGARDDGSPILGAGNTGFGQTVATVAAIGAAASVPWHTRAARRIVGQVLLVGYALHLAWWPMAGFALPHVGEANHKNVVGGAALAGLLISLGVIHLERMRSGGRDVVNIHRAAASAALLTIVLSGARTSITVGLVALVAIPLLSRDRHPARTRIALTAVALACSLLVPLALLDVRQLPAFEIVDGFVIDLTGKGIDSGRWDRWQDVWGYAVERPWLGRGYHYEEVFSTKTLHSHNLALATFFRSGLLGVTGLVTFLGWVMLRGLHRSTTALGTLLVALFLAHQTFEVNLFVGGAPIGLAVGVVFGFSIGVSALHPVQRTAPGRAAPLAAPSGSATTLR